MSISWKLGQSPGENMHHGRLLGEPREEEGVSASELSAPWSADCCWSPAAIIITTVCEWYWEPPLPPSVAKTLKWDHKVSLQPLIPRSAAGNVPEEYPSLPREGSRLAPHGPMAAPLWSHDRGRLRSAAGPHDPTTLSPAKTIHLSKEEMAWIRRFPFARRGDVSFLHGASPLDPVLDQSCQESKHQRAPHHSSYLWDCPRSRDQPSRGPAVALVPPLLNSVSDMSSGLKVVDWLLLSLV